MLVGIGALSLGLIATHITAVQWVLDGGAVPFLHFPQGDPIAAINFYRDYVLPKLH